MYRQFESDLESQSGDMPREDLGICVVPGIGRSAVSLEAIAHAGFRIASLQLAIGGWDVARRLPSMAKRLGCQAPYRYSGRVTHVAKF
jgi:hypothetical protein